MYCPLTMHFLVTPSKVDDFAPCIGASICDPKARTIFGMWVIHRVKLSIDCAECIWLILGTVAIVAFHTIIVQSSQDALGFRHNLYLITDG